MTLRCAACRTRLSVAEVVSSATLAPWPEEQIVTFPCPGCHGEGHARLRDGLAEVVTRTGPGRYLVHAALAEAELATVGSPQGVEVWLRGAHRSVPRRLGWQPPRGAVR